MRVMRVMRLTRALSFALVAVAACDAGEKKPSTTTGSATAGSATGSATTGSATPIVDAAGPKTMPPGPYVVRYDCFHSDMPFGKGSQYRNTRYDLGAKTLAVQAWELTGEEPRPPLLSDAAPGPKIPPDPTITKLAPMHAAAIEAAAVAVLRGGPYEPEYPVPEGTPCDLIIEAGGNVVFTINKAYTERDDAPSALVKSLAPPR